MLYIWSIRITLSDVLPQLQVVEDGYQFFQRRQVSGTDHSHACYTALNVGMQLLYTVSVLYSDAVGDSVQCSQLLWGV